MKRRRWLSIALVSAVIIGPMVYVSRTPIGMFGDMAALHRMGFGTTEEEVAARMPQVGENAASDYKEIAASLFTAGPKGTAFEILQKADPYCLYMSAPGTRTPLYTAKAAIPKLDILKPVLEKSVEASKKPRCVFKDMFDGANTPNSHYAAWVTAEAVVKVLYETAYLEGEAGHISDALHHLESSARVLGQLSKNRQFYATDGIEVNYQFVARTWMHLLPKCGRDRKLLAEWVAIGDAMPMPLEMKWAFSGNLAPAVDEYDKAIKDPNAYLESSWGGRSALAGTIYSKKFTMQYAKAQAVHEWRKLLENLPADPNEWKRAETMLQNTDQVMKTKWPMNKVFISYFQGSWMASGHAHAVANSRLMKTGAALMREWLDKGSFPSQLPALDGNSFDPVSQDSFDYQSDGSSFTIRSTVLANGDTGGGVSKSRMVMLRFGD